MNETWSLVIVDTLFANYGYAIAQALHKRDGTPYVLHEVCGSSVLVSSILVSSRLFKVTNQIMDWQASSLAFGKLARRKRRPEFENKLEGWNVVSKVYMYEPPRLEAAAHFNPRSFRDRLFASSSSFYEQLAFAYVRKYANCTPIVC